MIKNENDFISVEQDKDSKNVISLSARKRHSQQFHQAFNGTTAAAVHQNSQQQQQQQQQKRDENMRQLLDVTNTLTFEELRDFEMRLVK